MVRHSCFRKLLNQKANPGHPPCMYRPVLYGTSPQLNPESSLMLTGVPVK